MQLEISTITPETAKYLLGLNPSNRTINPHHVSRMSADMRKGKWVLNGDTIRIAENGDLMDGQHRLSACVASGVAFQTIMVRGVQADAIRTIDGGRKRSISDKFGMDGVTNARALVTSIRIVGRIATGVKSYQPSDQEFFELAGLHPKLAASVSTYRKVPFRLSSVVSAIHYMGSAAEGAAMADAFANTIRSGIPTRNADPAHTFREWVIKNSTGVGKLPLESIIAGACRAWSAYADGRELKRIISGGSLELAGWDRKQLFTQH